jgi:hypothetical protein
MSLLSCVMVLVLVMSATRDAFFTTQTKEHLVSDER